MSFWHSKVCKQPLSPYLLVLKAKSCLVIEPASASQIS